MGSKYEKNRKGVWIAIMGDRFHSAEEEDGALADLQEKELSNWCLALTEDERRRLINQVLLARADKTAAAKWEAEEQQVRANAAKGLTIDLELARKRQMAEYEQAEMSKARKEKWEVDRRRAVQRREEVLRAAVCQAAEVARQIKYGQQQEQDLAEQRQRLEATVETTVRKLQDSHNTAELNHWVSYLKRSREGLRCLVELEKKGVLTKTRELLDYVQ